MYRINNLQDNDDIRVADVKAGMKVIEYMSDLSVMPSTAITAYYCSRMNVRKRQLLINLENNEYTVSSGSMQWSVGNVEAVADVKVLVIFSVKQLKEVLQKKAQ